MGVQVQPIVIPPTTSGINTSFTQVEQPPFVAFANRTANRIGQFADDTLTTVAAVVPATPQPATKSNFWGFVILALAIAGGYFLFVKK